jgi:hypothetical protein
MNRSGSTCEKTGVAAPIKKHKASLRTIVITYSEK